MVIVCPECTTKFKVNQDRIPDSGAKVRCARCKHIFWAEKPVPEESLPDASAPETPQPEPEPIPEETTQGEETFSSPITEEPTAFEKPAAEESGFDYDQFREQDPPRTEESFTFSGESEELTAAPEPESEVSLDDKESFSFGDVQTDTSAAVEKISLDEETPATEETAILSQLTDDESLDDAFVEPPPLEKPKTGAVSSIIRILLLLILSILVIGGVLLYMNGPEQLEQVIQQLMGQQAKQPAETGQIALDNLQGKFLNNQEAGELFVIRGEAINKFSTPQASVQVKGVIFDQNGKSLLQKTIFCGNPISDDELQSLTFDKIEELMGNQFGKSLSNMNINKDQSLPFVIVFRDLPQSLSEFSVDVTSSKPATP